MRLPRSWREPRAGGRRASGPLGRGPSEAGRQGAPRGPPRHGRGGLMSISQYGATLDGFRGELFSPRDAGYDEARAVHNGMIDKRPALVARCADVADVQAALAYARDSSLDVAVRGG